MTKEEILKKTCEVFQVDGDKLYYEKQVLKAMDEYGRQCFEAAREKPSLENMYEYVTKDYVYEEYEDYLKELENDI